MNDREKAAKHDELMESISYLIDGGWISFLGDSFPGQVDEDRRNFAILQDALDKYKDESLDRRPGMLDVE